MARAKLNKKMIDKLATANPRGERWYDTVVRGFGVVVFPSGRKRFFIEWGHRRHRNMFYLDLDYGKLTLDKARPKAKALFVGIDKGIDPRVERQKDREALTFAEWTERYEAGAKQRKKSYRDDKRYLAVARKRWVGRRLDEITADAVERVFRSIAKDHKTAGNRFLASVRACLQEAWRLGLIESNPAAKVKSNPEGTPRARILSDGEFQALVGAINKYASPPIRTAFMLLLDTGARCSEVLRARWEDFDLAQGTWRIPSPKAGRPQVVPLAASSIAFLRKTQQYGPFVVPSPTDPSKHRFDLKDAWKTIRDAAELKDVRLHDLRRTVGYRVAKAEGLHIASKVLRHSDVRVTERAYAPLSLDEIRRGVEAVSEEARKLGRVLPMRPAVKKAV